MHRIMYSSTASKPLSEEDLDVLMRECRPRNALEGLTGILLHFPVGATYEECFLQVLEGGTGAVEDAYRRISLDPRHRDIHLIDSRPVEDRAFGEWAMALRRCPSSAVYDAAGLTRDLAPPGVAAMPDVAELLENPAVAEALLGLYAS